MRFATLAVGNGGLTIASGAGIESDVRDNAAAASLAERTTQALVAAAAGLQQKLTTNTVSETHVAWNNDRTTASPLVSIVVNLVLAVMLPGIGEALSTALGAIIPSVTSFVSNLPAMVQSVLTAAARSFVSSALTGAISGTFDLGKILKSTLSAGLTAGVLGFVNSALPEGLESLADKAQAGQLDILRAANDGSLLDPKLIGGSLIRVAVDTPIKAAIASAIEGRDFGKTLEADLRSGLASEVVEPVLYIGIGDLGVAQGLADGSLSKIVLHAGAGAVGGLIACGGTCAAGGALGAALNEAAIPGEEGFTPAQRQVTAQLLGGLGSLVVGDASMSGVTAAMNGEAYNDALHRSTVSAQTADVVGKAGATAGALAGGGAVVIGVGVCDATPGAAVCAPATPVVPRGGSGGLCWRRIGRRSGGQRTRLRTGMAVGSRPGSVERNMEFRQGRRPATGR